ncbi:MAG: phosphate/phosphite/phosphonate ABC transporter substrate-binding protein [Gammaproteobacteria bacterium]|jgi:phosphonate transport system substrate-binding protein
MNSKTTLAVLGVFLSLLASAQAVADVTMGVFPRRPIAVTHKAFKPLAEHLSRQLGEPVHLVIPKSFQAFWEGVEKKRFDLVHFNQYHYIKSHKEFGYEVIVANEEFGNKLIAGALSVRKDSGINSVNDLKGKTILFGGGKKAMGSYIAPTAILKTAGLVPDRDYKVQFAKNPPSAVIGVYNNAAQASGSGNVILRIKAVTKKIKADDIKILAESESFTHLPWAVKGDMPEDKANKIRDVMVQLKNTDQGKAILKSAKVTGFYPVTDADFAKVREITKFAVGEEY